MLKDELPMRPPITVEAASCLANASHFPRPTKVQSRGAETIHFPMQASTHRTLRKIKDRLIVSLHGVCKAEKQRRDEPRAVHIETGYLARRGRHSQGAGMWLLGRDDQPRSYAGRANPANCQPLGSMDFQTRSTSRGSETWR